jgi:hypothetical protein
MDDTITAPPNRDEAGHPETSDVKRSLDKANLSSQEKDRALALIERVGHRVELTPENNKRICRKIDLRILPVILFVYFLQGMLHLIAIVLYRLRYSSAHFK